MRIHTQNLGIANIWAVLMLPVMIGFTGLAIDMGYMAWVGQEAQACADASALAGAYYVHTDVDEARAAAVRIGLLNRAAGAPMQLNLNTLNAPEGDIVVGRFDRDSMTFNPASPTPNAVQVKAKRTADSLNGPVHLLFGPAFHVDEANIQRWAIAMVGGGTGSGMLVLDEHGDNALSVSGNATLTVNGGSIQVNSDSDAGAKIWGSVTMEAEELNMVGDGSIRVELSFPVNDGCRPMEDPLAFLPAPEWDPAADLGSVTGSPIATIAPGYYSGGIDVTGGHLTMEPGIYILGGTGMRIRGNAALTAQGVMLYIITPGCFDLAGTGDLVLSPPDPDIHTFPGAATYEGVTVFQARDNSTPSNLTGTSGVNWDLDGSYYFPAAEVDIGGTADIQCGNQLIANRVAVSGTGTVTINYDGRFPAPGNHVFLVQ